MNLIHVQGFVIGVSQVLVGLRYFSGWRPAMQAWRVEQERQLRVLLVLFRQVGGHYGALHRWMLRLAEAVGWFVGVALSAAPVAAIRFILKQGDDTLTTGLERAGHQIAIADWSAWEVEPSLNPPKSLLELSAARREWPSKWAGLVQFL